jgi:DNA-binding GntR family transcriptional regulator
MSGGSDPLAIPVLVSAQAVCCKISRQGYSDPMLDKSPLSPPHPAALEGRGAFAERRLRDALRWCELLPGEQVSEPALADRFGLGRAAVRQAMTRLAADGLVAALPRKGWRVQALTGQSLGALIRARRQLEPLLAGTALAPDLLGRLAATAELVDMLRGRPEAQSQLTARQYERELMDALAGGLGPHAGRWLASLWDEAERTVRFLERQPGAAACAGSARAPLVTAIAAGDHPAAVAEIGRDIDAFERFVTAHLLRSAAELGETLAGPSRRRRPVQPSSTGLKAGPSHREHER